MDPRQEIVGKRFPPQSHTVTQAEAWAYALATNDPNPMYEKGDIAPPMFAVYLEMPPLMDAIKAPEVIVDSKRFLRLLHGEHDLRWHQPLRPGVRYSTEASIARVVTKASGEIIDLKLETRDAAGLLCVETVSSMFIRSESKGPAEAKPSEGKPNEQKHDRPAPVFSTDEHVAKDQSVRYAQASGDHNPIHTDPAVAQKAGLPGIVLHGLCTMAFCQKAVVDKLCGGDPRKLKRLKVRFAKPVLMEQTLTIAGWPLAPNQEGRSYALEARVGDAVVLKDGIAEIAG